MVGGFVAFDAAGAVYMRRRISGKPQSCETWMVVTYRQVRHPFRDLVPSDLLRFVGSDVMGLRGMAARYDIAGWENEETRQ